MTTAGSETNLAVQQAHLLGQLRQVLAAAGAPADAFYLIYNPEDLPTSPGTVFVHRSDPCGPKILEPGWSAQSGMNAVAIRTTKSPAATSEKDVHGDS